MLLEEFDSNKVAIFNPDTFDSKIEEMPKTCVSFFSKTIMKYIVENFEVEQIANISNATANFPVYKINIDGTDIAVYQSAVGAPACVSNAEELIAMGVKNLLLVGCCGCLEDELEEYSIIIPTSAIRDEGTSYHYQPVSDETEIAVKMVKTIENFIKSKSISYSKGKTWTTDAIFRETKDKVAKRKKQGAIIVDMECSAMNVLAEFRGVNFGQIFYAADNLGAEEYDPRHLMLTGESDMDSKVKIISLALECGLEIDKKFNLENNYGL